MTARKLIAEVAVVAGWLVLHLAPAAGRWDYSAVAHDVAFVCSSILLAQDSFKPENQGVPGEYWSFGHLAIIQIKCYPGRSLETLILTAVSIWGRLPLGTQSRTHTSIQSTTACTLGACRRNCSPSIRTRITFFLFR